MQYEQVIQTSARGDLLHTFEFDMIPSQHVVSHVSLLLFLMHAIGGSCQVLELGAVSVTSFS